MPRRHVGSKENSILNGEWAKHGRKDGKQLAAARRRQLDKSIVRKELTDCPLWWEAWADAKAWEQWCEKERLFDEQHDVPLFFILPYK